MKPLLIATFLTVLLILGMRPAATHTVSAISTKHKPHLIPKLVQHTAATVKPVIRAVIAPVYTGNNLLMHEAGIADSDFAAVDYIVSHESSWDVDATEPNSGAHGLVQALPYSKTGCGWSDAVCQLNWANTYARVRYGGWWSAQAYWSVHRNW
jgi:hypothetical protein